MRLLQFVPEADVAALAELGSRRWFRPQQYIVRQGEDGDALYTILNGSVRIAMTSDRGAEATVTTLGPGESIGELSLLDGHPRSADAIALTRTQTLVVGREAFERWRGERPGVSAGLLRGMAQLVRRTDAILADFTFLTLAARLARRLLDLRSSQTERGRAPETVRVTQAELASWLGVSRESVNKELQRLAHGGLIRTRRGGVEIPNLNALRAFAGGEVG
jgi:CRP/FNR family cyclic AMP-dependent transcriptional regulator